MILFLAEHAAALAVLLVVAAAAGTLIAGRDASIGLRLALGLAVCGQLLVLLGIAGLLYPWILYSLAIGLTAAGVARGGRISLPRWSWLIAVATVPFFLLALFPPIAFDETLYHLPFVQALARAGQIEFLGHLRHPAFPQLHELLCLPFFLAVDDVATHLVSLAEVLILGALLIGAFLINSGRDDRRLQGILAAALCLGHPIVVQYGTVNHAEAALMLFVGAGFVCLDCSQNHPRFYSAAAGFFLGTACCTKYLAWYFAAAGLAYLFFFGTDRKRTIPLFLTAMLIAVLPMYGEIVHLTGNPMHPFLKGIFGASQWTPPDEPHVSAGTHVVRALRLFWDITFARERINQQPHYSPFFALAFAITLLASLRDRRAAFVSAVCIVYIAIFTFLPQDSRYLMPLLPLVSLAAARIVMTRISALPKARELTVALSLLAIVPAFAYAAYRLAKQGWPPSTAAQRATYLEQRIPEYRAVHRREPGLTFLCGAEELQSYGNFIGDYVGPGTMSKIFGRSHDAAELAQTLQRLGANQLLVSHARCPDAWRSLPREPYFRLMYQDDGATLWRVPLQSAR